MLIQNIFDYLTVRGFKPKTHWLYNEAPDLQNKFNQEIEADFKLAPPRVHRLNAA